jgi:hypothetical protein
VGIILQNIGTVLSYQQKSPLLETLKVDCPKLEELQDDFRHQGIRFNIVSCFAQKFASPLNSLVSLYLFRCRGDDLSYFRSVFLAFASFENTSRTQEQEYQFPR